MTDSARGPAPLTPRPSIVIISDRVDRTGSPGEAPADWSSLPPRERPWQGAAGDPPEVAGGYLERLPLACIAAGIVEQAEIWHHQQGGHRPPIQPAGPHLTYRGFLIDDLAAPFDNWDMLAFVHAYGAPHILVVYGLGVSAALLDACAHSIIVYNSIDAPTLRVPGDVSARFDLVLTGAQWQSDEVEARHSGMATAILPVGPEFAAIDQFRPTGAPKDYDLIYVAAAQGYKRHDILLDALEALPRDIRALFVFGYGEDADAIRRRIADADLSVDCIGPPGVPFDQVNRLMNRARFGVVAGRDDGAPAILTEYMLAGLPVLCNAELVCGRQYILPETGRLTPPDRFAEAILAMRTDAAGFSPRETVLARWTWPHTIERLRPLLAGAARQKKIVKLMPVNGVRPLASQMTLCPLSENDMHGPGPSSRATPMSEPALAPLICFSHLRWDFVTQRPQHLMRRFAAERRVFFWEEPIACDHPLPYLEHHPFPADNVIALRPRVPHWWSRDQVEEALRGLLDMLVATSVPADPILWFYTPMMLGFAGHLRADTIVYDCMDELSAFAFADPLLAEREAELMRRADVMFTGGYSLYEAKRDRHDAITPFPSAVDVAHFAAARGACAEAGDQQGIPGPRLGFYGVIDERIDLPLIDALAAARPHWQIVMVGPVVKIAPATLPRHPNIHWLGGRAYDDLPAYLTGWSVALMPFAINAATRYLSPTKTPEYLAAGRPVVSTPIADVVRHYGDLSAVAIAADAPAFIAACDAALALPSSGAWRDQADALLAATSWDCTFEGMKAAIMAPRPARAAPAIRPAGRRPHYDALVVGAGFAGAVLAERLAAGSGKRVLVIDKRPHIAGNAFDHQDSAGILVHRYGPHIFHTNSDDVFAYLSRFTAWRGYQHRVLANVRGMLVPIPINRTTLNMLYGLDLADDAAAAAFLAARAEPREIHTSEDVVVAAVGQELYETFFRGYTRKQWGLDPSELDKAVTARVPTRTNTDDRYFSDTHQAMPRDGYTAMFTRMLDHPNISVETGVDFADCDVRAEHTVYTGPIDEYFGHRFGPLPYRSLEFRHETHDVERYQPVAVVNYPAPETPYTRITEYKHLTGQQASRTSISYEFPRAEGDPYYPIPRPENQALFRRYAALADALPDVSFVGRLATYRYYNMDQVVGQALAAYRRLVPHLDRTTAAA